MGRMVDLRAEMLTFGLRWPGCQRLIAAGVDGRFACKMAGRMRLGQAQVSVSRDDQWFEPEGPDARLLIGVDDDRGDLVDICAVALHDPKAFSRRTGVGVFLGAEHIEQRWREALAMKPSRLKVFADPLEWLRAKGHGIVVLDWAAALPELRLLGERVTLDCDAAFAPELRAKLQRGGLPLVASTAVSDARLSLAERLGRGEREAA